MSTRILRHMTGLHNFGTWANISFHGVVMSCACYLTVDVAIQTGRANSPARPSAALIPGSAPARSIPEVPCDRSRLVHLTFDQGHLDVCRWYVYNPRTVQPCPRRRMCRSHHVRRVLCNHQSLVTMTHTPRVVRPSSGPSVNKPRS